jgi:hypothetical protein
MEQSFTGFLAGLCAVRRMPKQTPQAWTQSMPQLLNICHSKLQSFTFQLQIGFIYSKSFAPDFIGTSSATTFHLIFPTSFSVRHGGSQEVISA